MQSKPHRKSWTEIQLAMAAVAVTITLAFWNWFSTPQKQQVVEQSGDTTVPPSPVDPSQSPTAAPTPAFVPFKIIFGGLAPLQPTAQVQPSTDQTSVKRRAGGGGGGSAPAASTGSSKP
jgi:hypothetical protein